MSAAVPGQYREDDRRAATGVIPYVVTSETWFASSSWSRRTRLGTAASLAGIQKRHDPLDEGRRDEEPDQLADDRDRGEEREPHDVADDHRLSPVEPVGEGAGQRAEHDAGSSRTTRTPPSAKLAAAKPSASAAAMRGDREQASQSPKLDNDMDSHSLRKSRTFRTARILAPRPTEPRDVVPRDLVEVHRGRR